MKIDGLKRIPQARQDELIEILKQRADTGFQEKPQNIKRGEVKEAMLQYGAWYLQTWTERKLKYKAHLQKKYNEKRNKKIKEILKFWVVSNDYIQYGNSFLVIAERTVAPQEKHETTEEKYKFIGAYCTVDRSEYPDLYESVQKKYSCIKWIK